MRLTNKCFAAAALALVALPLSAYPQGLIEPTLRWPSTPQVERVSSDVSIVVDAQRRVAHVEVEEVFRNRSSLEV